MNQELEQARREFLDECDLVVRTPAVWFLKGDSFSYSAHVISIPIHIFLGIKKQTKKKDLQIKICDGSTYLYDILPNNMKLLQPNDDLLTFTSKYLLEFELKNYIQKLEKPQNIPDNWAELTHYNKLLKMINKLGNFRLRIWSELPICWPCNRHNVVNVAFSTLIHCLEKKLTPSDFNSLKDEYKQKIIDTGKDRISLGFIGEQSKSKNHSLQIVNDIFKTAWLLSYGSNGAECFSSLLGGFERELYEDPYLGMSYEISAPKEFEKCKDLSQVWFIDCLERGVVPTIEFISFLVDTLNNNKFCFKLSVITSRDTNMLLIFWKDKERGLFGPILEPLFLDSFPEKIGMTWRDESSWLFTRTHKLLSYAFDLLQILGPRYALERIGNEFKRNNFLSRIYYDSTVMGWDYEGTKVLEHEEYKIITKVKNGEFVIVKPSKEKKIKILTKYYVEFKEKIVAIYLKGDDGKKFLFESKRTQQPYQLLEYFLSKEDRRVHWVEAIKIFPDWQVKRKEDTIGLKGIFEGVIAKINTDFNNIREKLLNDNIIMEKINIEEHHGFYTLTTQIESNVADAKNLVKEALNIADDDFDTANKKVVEALQTHDKCIEAAILILELKDKAKFGSKIMNDAQLILSEQKDILERIVKPTVDYYVREKEKLGWTKTQINEKIEFNNYIETLANDSDHEIETIKECLKDIPETQDEECEEIKRFIKRDLCKIENSNALLQKEPIKELIDNLMHRIRDRQSKDKFERDWAWFKNITTDKELIELLKSWLIDAIERGKKKLNAQFIRAKILKDLLKHLDRMTMAVGMEEMYRQKTKEELSKKQLIDLRKAKKLYAEIMAEYEKKGKGNPTREDVIESIIVKTERDKPFAERLLWLLEKGSELSFDDTRYGQKDSNEGGEN